MPLTTIHLKGDLAEKFTPQFTANITCARDASRALEANFPGFRQHILASHQKGISYRVTVGDDWDLDEDQLYLPTGRSPITITPIVGGSGTVGRIVAGVALLGLGAFGGVGLLGMSAGQTALVGGVLALGGVTALFKKPKADPGDDEKKTSLMFNGPVNTTGAGGVVPVVFGEVIMGSQVLSGSIRTTMQWFDDEDDSNG